MIYHLEGQRDHLPVGETNLRERITDPLSVFLKHFCPSNHKTAKSHICSKSEHDRPHGGPSRGVQSFGRCHQKRARMRGRLRRELGRGGGNLSAASAHAKKEPAAVDAEVSKEDLAFIKASQDALKAAKSGEMDKAVLDSIETAKSLGKVQGKVKESARVKELSKSLEIALKAAKECTEDCAVEWETVEEISDAKEREQAKGN